MIQKKKNKGKIYFFWTMKICTVATNSQRYFPVLQESCKRFNVELVVLGWGEKWRGYAWKFQKMLGYLETLEPDDVVLFIDAYDVVLLQDPKVLEQRFKSSGKKMIVAKDGNHPNFAVSYLIHYVFHPVKSQYINTGTYIGYAGYMLDLLTKVSQYKNNGFSEKENDQELMSRYCQEFPDALDIDTNGSLFATLYGGNRYFLGNKYRLESNASSLKVEDKQIYTRGGGETSATWETPCVLHGPCNTDLGELLSALDYKTQASSVGGGHLKYLQRQFCDYWQFFWSLLVLIIIVLLFLVAVCLYMRTKAK